MDKDFEPDLKGSENKAFNAKQEIAKWFKRYGDSGHEESEKHQLMFASKIMCIISKCGSKHLNIYCNIIDEIFGDKLHPESNVKYWTLYSNCIRYFHYILVEKKDFEKASLIYRHISCYKNKLQNIENGLTYINIYCYQLFLQNSLKSKNPEQAICEATDVIINLNKLLNEISDTNTKQNFQYPDILQKSMSWLFPQNKTGPVYHFIKILPTEKVREMFQSLFTFYGRQTIDTTSNEEDVQEHAKCIIEIIYTLLQVDIMDKMHMQLSVQLMANCRTECRLQTYKPIAESFLLLYDYLKLLCDQKPTPDFQNIYSILCERFKYLFEKYAKSVMNQSWFGDFLVLIFYLHSQLQNQLVFSCFWKQMNQPECFKAMFKLFVELMKLAPCISAETKLFTTNCCTSARKHVILSFAQIALASFVFYCQNISEEDEKKMDIENCDSNLTDDYKEMIQNNLILIINHAFKIIDKMDCITSNSQEIEIILTRFKQVTLSSKTYRQAGTCIAICELFLKIKTKIAGKEWPLLLRRLYKTVTQLLSNTPHIGREIQMCYIASILHNNINEIDINQIRTQIGIFYASGSTTINTNDKQQQHEHCLLDLYNTTNSLLKPHLEHSRKRLLHWLESQHIIKYYKSNSTLLHSVLKFSQSHYDFVLITKLGKLQTYAMAKITSLYKTLKSKDEPLSNLSRLEQLTFGHVCVIILNDMNTNQKFQVESKDLCEEQLEKLFLREEMASITIYNDLKRFKLAWRAFKAFENFYEKFDSEIISMDDAIIDWESILDDVASIALYLQLSGYMEHSVEAWLLHYKCSRLIHDDFSALRGLAFFCEYSEHFPRNSENSFIKLEEEIHNNFANIIHGLENLLNLQRQAFQSYILLAVLQIAHYYARSSRLSFAQMLFQYVEQKHAELPERQGRYDLVLATMDAIKFRLLWKNFDETKVTRKENACRTNAENLLLHRCLLHEVEETLDRFHDFSYISSCDGLLYSILIINLVQELAECTANRLCDSFINALFIAACKCTLLMGLALRFVQVMSKWMWVNLQMEYVDRAQVKLQLIEFVMGMKSLNELTKKFTTKLCDNIESSTLLNAACSKLLTPSYHNPDMEAIRKLAQVQLSPIKTNKLQLSPSHQNSDLKLYLNCNIDTKLVELNEHIEWTFFMVGCLNARLYFLVENFAQLELFYESGKKWLQRRQNCFNKKYYTNIHLMAMQHYANFLRSRRQYDKALNCLEYGMQLCEANNYNIDATYSLNFYLQMKATQKEMNSAKNITFRVPTHSKPRRALQFNITPEKQQQKTPAKSDFKEKIMKPVTAYTTDIGCSTSKKMKNQTGLIGSSSSSTLDVKSTRQKLKFEICEDFLEIVETNDIENNIKTTPGDKPSKRKKLIEENDRIYKTPKTVRKTSKSAKTTGSKSYAKNRKPETIPKFIIDSPLSSPTLKSSSLKALESKENFNSNELVAKMQNLEIEAKEISIKKSKSRTKLNPNTESVASIIVLEDSPCTTKPPQIEIENKSKSSRTRATSKDKLLNGLSTCEDILASSSRPRRQKKLTLTNNDKPSLQNISTSTCSSIASTPITTRRRQKNLV